MAVHAEGVESCLCAQVEIRPLAAMARDAIVDARAVDEVVVARDAIDGAVFLVRKVDRKPLRALYERLEHQFRAALVLLSREA